MLDSKTSDEDLSKVLKADPTGEAMRRYRSRLSTALDKAQGVSCTRREDTTIKALQAAMALLPALWRDLNRR